jgi:ferredoxin-NADP reductase/predicted pyridoxine 5'-phosphate oxidase superfamily flavin-nucleotide-binding protein
VSTPSPFHAGEQEIQARLGVRETIEPWARKVVSSRLPDQHSAFYAELPFLVAAARDERGRPWATLLVGEPGFASSPDPATLTLAAVPVEGDALERALVPGADVGFLGIQLETRRRNRVNGRIARAGDDGIALAVEQAYGNCPQYIRERVWRRALTNASRPSRRVHTHLSYRLRRIVESADTFFIATGHRGTGESPAFGMDASHRGGEPGFALVEGGRRIVFPDYAGNNHFNSLGNLALDPRAGLLFVDFEGGDLLQLTGVATVDWDPAVAERFPGARRLLRFELDEAVELRDALPLRWEAPGESARELRLVDKVRESADVTSFVFEARDGGPLPDFSSGQHLPLEIPTAGSGGPLARTYSLSNAPGDGRYRISVKREVNGLASRRLHDAVEVGAILAARTPRGDFVLDHETSRPVVLVSAGVGLTPMLSMLHTLAERADGTPVWFVHSARDGGHHALADEVRRLTGAAAKLRLHVAYTRPLPKDVLGRDYHRAGRLDAAALAELVPDLDADFYLCGPVAFMAAIQSGLEERGVNRERIHSESFGPA